MAESVAMAPIALSDSQMSELRTLAQPIPVQLRSAFLQAVAAQLVGREIGDGVLYKIAVDVQRQLLRG